MLNGNSQYNAETGQILYTRKDGTVLAQPDTVSPQNGVPFHEFGGVWHGPLPTPLQDIPAPDFVPATLEPRLFTPYFLFIIRNSGTTEFWVGGHQQQPVLVTTLPTFQPASSASIDPARGSISTVLSAGSQITSIATFKTNGVQLEGSGGVTLTPGSYTNGISGSGINVNWGSGIAEMDNFGTASRVIKTLRADRDGLFNGCRSAPDFWTLYEQTDSDPGTLGVSRPSFNFPGFADTRIFDLFVYTMASASVNPVGGIQCPNPSGTATVSVSTSAAPITGLVPTQYEAYLSADASLAEPIVVIRSTIDGRADIGTPQDLPDEATPYFTSVQAFQLDGTVIDMDTYVATDLFNPPIATPALVQIPGDWRELFDHEPISISTEFENDVRTTLAIPFLQSNRRSLFFSVTSDVYMLNFGTVSEPLDSPIGTELQLEDVGTRSVADLTPGVIRSINAFSLGTYDRLVSVAIT